MSERSKELYMQELNDITPCTLEEMNDLFTALHEGEKQAAQRLIEGNLYRVADLAKEYDGQGVPFMDLIQEGNMALTMAVYESDGEYFTSEAENAVRNALEQLIEEQGQELENEQEITARVNVVDEVCRRLAQEYGREATVEEVAAKMNMTVEEVKTLLNMALNAVKK